MVADSAEILPAWMEAQELLIKARGAMMEKAVEILYKEIDEERMDVGESFIRVHDKKIEMEQGAILINNLMESREEVSKSLSSRIKRLETHPELLDAERSKTLGDSKKSLDALEKIAGLVECGRTFESWFDEADMKIDEEGDEPAAVLARTCGNNNTPRADALRFVVNSRFFKEEGIFTQKERRIFYSAVERLKRLL